MSWNCRSSRRPDFSFPQPVRAVLHLREGDDWIYQIEAERVSRIVADTRQDLREAAGAGKGMFYHG
jgi:hypothetical protein